MLKMTKFRCLLIVSVICAGALAEDENQRGFVQPLDFAPIFGSKDFDTIPLASKPITAAVLNIDKSKYPDLFDAVVSSSIDSIQKRLAPVENKFSAEYFGFKPIPSQGFHSPASVRTAKLVAQPDKHIQNIQNQKLLTPLQYDIRTLHDANYKVYKPEEEQNEEILAPYKNNPAVAAYFQPSLTNLEVTHPIKYRKEELLENPEAGPNYKPNAYITGSPRIRRYTGGRRRENLRKKNNDEEDPYNYEAEYVSRPKAFDTELYSAYREEKDPNKDYEYPYGYDSGYDHKEYERIKELSEKQAAEIKQNPGNCKEVKKDDMTCMVCKDPKTGGNYESCSYVAEPKNNKYAYSKEKKFDSNDEPDEPESVEKDKQGKPVKYEEDRESKSSQESQEASKPYASYTKEETTKPYDSYKKEETSKPYASYRNADKDDDSREKYKAYYVHSSHPKPSEALKSAEEDSSEKKEPESVSYNYKKAIPGFYTDNEPKKDVENVLAEFKKKDRSTCKKVQKNGMTCFQCTDKSGIKNEECMFVSESAPKRSHLAYQELKEFTSKPTTIDDENKGAESQAVTNATPPVKSAAYVVSTNSYGKKLKRKKASQAATSATSPVIRTVAVLPKPNEKSLNTRKVKRSVDSEAESKAEIRDETNVAPPEEFAGDNSKGAFWAETQPRYSAALGVTLPEFMLTRSEHEILFDEVISGA